MKKLILCLITVSSLFLITACNNNSKIDFKEDVEHQINSDYTFKFVGESEHFYFETGKVYYNGDERELLISNFKVKDNVNKNAKFSTNLYFNNVLFCGDISNSSDLSTKQEFENAVISEHGFLGEKDQNGDYIGESDSFVETSKEDFKDSIKLEGKYCIKDDCKIETFKIKYLEEK